MSELDGRSFAAVIAESALDHTTVVEIAPVAPLAALVGAARQGILDRRIVNAAVMPLRHTHLGARGSAATRDAMDLAELVDMVWVCVTAGQAASVLDAAVPALDVAWLVAGPLGVITDGRDPVTTIADRLDPSSPPLTSSLFADLNNVVTELSRGEMAPLHQARRDVEHTWGDLVGITTDLSRLRIYSKLSNEQLLADVALAQGELGDDCAKWGLAANLALKWPGDLRSLLAAVRSLTITRTEQ